MKHLKIARLCLMAVCVMSTVAAASAGAEVQTKPYMIQCRGSSSGHWLDEQCQKEPRSSGGNFDTRAAGSEGDETFSSTEGPGKLETAGENEKKEARIVECSSGRDEGKIKNDKEFEKVFVRFFGCKEPAKKVACNSAGAAEGEIRTNELNGKIGFLNKAEQKVGLLLEPTVVGGFFAEFECTMALKLKVGGSVIDEIEPGSLNRTTKVIYQCYKLKPGEKGKQEWTKLEGEGVEKFLETTLTGGAKERSGIEVQVQIEFQFDVEIVTS